MTKLFQLIAVMVLFASGAAAQQAPSPKPPDQPPQQAAEAGDIVITVLVDEPAGPIVALAGPLVINADFDAAVPRIAGAVRFNNNVTITTFGPHGLTPCTIVTITGVTDPSFNGTFTITLATSTSFGYAQDGGFANSDGGQVLLTGSTTAAEKVVIQQAVNEWMAIVQNSGTTANPFPLSVRFTALGVALPTCTGGTLGLTSPLIDGFGNIRSANMAFNTGVAFYEGLANPPPGSSTDLLTTVRHELGHALGWAGGPGGSVRVNSLLMGNAFNPPRLNIPVVFTGGFHTDPAWRPITCQSTGETTCNDIMVPTIPPATRRSISLYPAASLVARAFEYIVPMQYVDPTSTGTEDGSAVHPWQTLFTACTPRLVNMPLLLANTTHHVPVPFRCASPYTLNGARNLAVVSP